MSDQILLLNHTSFGVWIESVKAINKKTLKRDVPLLVLHALYHQGMLMGVKNDIHGITYH